MKENLLNGSAVRSAGRAAPPRHASASASASAEAGRDQHHERPVTAGGGHRSGPNANANNNSNGKLLEKDRRADWLRIRADSVGSTRGAFGNADSMKKIIRQQVDQEQHQHQHQHQHPPPPPPRGGRRHHHHHHHRHHPTSNAAAGAQAEGGTSINPVTPPSRFHKTLSANDASAAPDQDASSTPPVAAVTVTSPPPGLGGALAAPPPGTGSTSKKRRKKKKTQARLQQQQQGQPQVQHGGPGSAEQSPFKQLSPGSNSDMGAVGMGTAAGGAGGGGEFSLADAASLAISDLAGGGSGGGHGGRSGSGDDVLAGLGMLQSPPKIVNNAQQTNSNAGGGGDGRRSRQLQQQQMDGGAFLSAMGGTDGAPSPNVHVRGDPTSSDSLRYSMDNIGGAGGVGGGGYGSTATAGQMRAPPGGIGGGSRSPPRREASPAGRLPPAGSSSSAMMPPPGPAAAAPNAEAAAARRQMEINAFAAIAQGGMVAEPGCGGYGGGYGGGVGEYGGYGSTQQQQQNGNLATVSPNVPPPGPYGESYHAAAAPPDAAAGGGGGGDLRQLRSQLHAISIDAEGGGGGGGGSGYGSSGYSPQVSDDQIGPRRGGAGGRVWGGLTGLVARLDPRPMFGGAGAGAGAMAVGQATTAAGQAKAAGVDDGYPDDEVLDGYDGDGNDWNDNVSADDEEDEDEDEDEDEPSEDNLFWETCYTVVYDPRNPEFSSTQQFTWAVLLGIFFGIFTAAWGSFIELCVEFVWVDVPEKLLEWGVFTDLDGHLPLPHYMWICPTVFGGILAFINVKLPKPIPDQNEWIETLHRIGILNHETFLNLLLISTAGMASGLSLGPELPLVLSSGMVGSYLGLKTHQSILSARVMNLTAGSAAIAGFFGFPMAGALFVLELPHQMGLQYFEALSPATIASIVAVLVNRMVTGNEIKGYFNYPWLTSTLPSHLFYIAIVYGLFGAAVGIGYADGVKKLKTWTHDWFHHHDDHNEQEDSEVTAASSESIPLVGTGGLIMKTKNPEKFSDKFQKVFSFGIKHEPTRAAVVGALGGAITGVICMFVPHDLFWGEAQLQTLIDKGATPLPFFGQGDEPTAIMTAYGYCMIDPEDDYSVASGFGMGCAALFAVSKTLTIGLSIGTGIIGGHFWGPLFVGCAASHFFTDLMSLGHQYFGIAESLSKYPCVSILCIMGSTHVVTFRAHMAIMLILTLTISSFAPGDDGAGGGDYSAVFPLLVVSCFVSLMITRSHIFYKQQRCRGDIIASPQVLCEPMKEGTPEYPQHEVDYERSDEEGTWYDDDHYDDDDDDDDSSTFEDGTLSASLGGVDDDVASPFGGNARAVQTDTTQDDIEREFLEMQQRGRSGPASDVPVVPVSTESPPESMSASDRLNQILSRPLDKGAKARENRTHRRIKSTPDAFIPEDRPASLRDLDTGYRERTASVDRKPGRPAGHVRTNSIGSHRRSGSMDAHRRTNSIDRSVNLGAGRPSRDRAESANSRSSTPTQSILARVSSFGEIAEFQPSLLNQARKRASSVTRVSPALPKPSGVGRHSRSNSNASASMLRQSAGEAAGALSQEDLERSFSTAVHQMNLPR